MTTKTYAGKRVDVDAEGFLLDADQWTPEVAQGIAEEAGLALTCAHWSVIRFVRGDTATTGVSPGPRRITTSCPGVTMRDLYALFPKGPGKLVARVAGVPKPKACL